MFNRFNKKQTQYITGLDWQSPVHLFSITQCARFTTLQALLLSSTSVAVALPDKHVLYKSLLFDAALHASDIGLLLKEKTEQYLGEGEWQFDYYLQGISDQQKDQQKVHVIAAPKSYFQNIITMLENNKIYPEIIDIESYAMARCIRFLFLDAPECFAMYRCDQEKIQHIIISENMTIYSQEISIVDLQQSYLLFQANFPDKKIKANYIFGNDLKLGEKKSLIETTLDISTVTVNPFSKISSDKTLFANISYEDGPAFVLACGLALRENNNDFSWNLLPWRETENKQRRQKWISLLLLTVLINLGLIFLAHIVLLVLSYHQDNLNKHLREKAFVAQQILAEKQRLSPIVTLTVLGKIIPEDIYLTQISLQVTQLTLQGNVMAPEQFNKLVKNIQATPQLGRLISQQLQPDNTNPPYNYKFNLQINFQDK